MEVTTGYKQTDIGIIPTEWSSATIGELFSLSAGGDFDKAQSSDERDQHHQYPVYSNALTDKGLYAYSTNARYPAHSITITARGMVGSANYRDHPFTAIGRVLVLIPSKTIDARFTADYINQYVRFPNESTGVPQLTAPQAARCVICVPPLPEQQAIAKALSDVDDLIASLDALIAKKCDVKQAAMQQLLTGKTRLQGFSGEWETRRLGEVAFMGSGGTPTSNNPIYYDGDINWVSISDMTANGKYIVSTERRLTNEGLMSCSAKQFPAGTVLYAMYASLGECSIAGVEMSSSQAILGIKPANSLYNQFLYYWLCFLKPLVKSMGQQGTQSNLNKGIVQRFEILLPSVNEQKCIAEVLTDMDAELTALEQRRDKTIALKHGMMQELLTGRSRLV